VSSANGQYPGAQPVPADLKGGFDAIKTGDSKRILNYLATKCDGRGTGQKGFEKAAKFVAGEFKRIGLKPLGPQASYFQTAEISAGWNVHVKFRGPGGTLVIDPKNYQFNHNNSFWFSGPATLSGPPAFIQYAGKPAKLPEAAELKHKVVFLYPRRDLISEDSDAEDDNETAFDSALRQAEPAAIFVIVDNFEEVQKNGLTQLGTFHGAEWRLEDEPAQRINPGYGLISVRELKALLEMAGASELTGPSRGSATVTFGTEPLNVEITGHVEKVKTANVVGLLEGTDPVLKSEYVVVGAHLDHFGIQDGKTYPGADDDASGSTAVIEVAKAMATNPRPPRRSIVFVTFFGEEQRLLGSRYFVAHPPIPLDKVVAMLQMDDVGRDSEGPQQQQKPTTDRASENTDTVRLVGSRASTKLDGVVREMNAFVGLHLLDDAEYASHRSDQANFARKGIPVCWWFTGYNLDWHKPSDTVDKINWLKLTSITKHVYLTAHALADMDSPPAHIVGQPGSSK
jgi:Zn-dependent M28 family amino/carboxypeptidase